MARPEEGNDDTGADYPTLPLSLVVYHSVAVTATTITAAIDKSPLLLSLAIAAATTAATSAAATDVAIAATTAVAAAGGRLEPCL
ncbi:hypothetical protein BDZ91DRAFT_798213 [Kalaharituber pfeilii]|nr:hypothetical protein BDZ91DRAFT_798213 [Kalaharituber pfeilii]